MCNMGISNRKVITQTCKFPQPCCVIWSMHIYITLSCGLGGFYSLVRNILINKIEIHLNHFLNPYHCDCTAWVFYQSDVRSYGRLFFPLNMAMSRRSHGFLMARQSYGNLGVSTELLGVLVGNCLCSNCALTALPLRVSSCHGAHTAYVLCFTALPLLWWRFVCIPCSNLKVITPGPPPSSSAEPAFRQAVALVDCAH